MKTISILIKDGKIDLDFNGFIGHACEHEENNLRALYGKMGVTTNVEHSDNKREAKANGVAEREQIGS